ncbi:BppU family phage baseplate upper protein [Lactobacillus paragasseri]|uniref:BppU family phage baseplate upper protein n=1 Tax=Lactobacillus paragasseri TaxID=2107999 RepID=UPI0029C4929E|nr:BppU family phage baseplate upper protein [Lactobacillus paragasseri]MDX5123152.1 BppU family phage baseplate upper protein [Lactobacillus paragasseri]MDX5128882.1 BppU family phage baseplate upper protein [Lactobacillus paragasseri]MDX5132386.1 BppU family phage baseplate upper protein [Lactobacillus paragasseri]MDX5136336.1 BppU family phage baseplate upper protein [Lactobacillus paragasseri]MDX5140016.1 BppU family phage baseplate upper protein [Lactobacillus paragasseri]
MLQAVALSTNKQTTNLSRVEVRDSDKGEILESFILNPDGTPYDLTNKSLVFNENKDGNKFVSDDNVKIVDARIGHITYQLHDQVHSARGTAWFDIIDKSNGSKIDSTTDFYIEVRDSLKCTVYNTTYIADLEKLKQQMEALIKQADGEFKAELQKAEQQLNQELQNFRNQYNTLSADFQNQFRNAQNAINQDWTNNKNQIWGQWNGDKANIDKQAQDTIQAVKNNAKQVLDKDQADWNAKQHSWDDTFSRIVKEWQVKTNSLNNTVQDLTTKFGNIINELTDLMNKKLPDMNAKTDAVQAKVNELRASLGQIDWTSFAKDLELKKWIFNSEPGWIQLKSNMTQWGNSNEMIAAARISYDDVSRMNIYDYTGVAGIERSMLEVSDLTPNTLYRLFFEWENSKQLTKIADNDYKFRVSVYDKNNTDNILAYQDLPADPVNKELFCLTFDTNNVTDVFIELNTGGLNDGIHFTWKIGNWLLKPVQEHVPIVAIKNNTDLNTIKTPGMYHARGTDGIANSPIPAWFDITVNSDGMQNGTQMLHAKKENQVYVRSWYNGNTFTDWQRITNAGDLATKLSLSGGNMQKGSWINWDAQSPYNAHEGNIGGIQWNGASDSIKIFGDNNASENLDLAIQLGNDDSNHISFRRADGDEVAAINMDGYYTGSVGWNNIRSKPDVAQKSDLNVNVIRDYNIETDQPGPTTVEQAGKPGLVDQATLATFARAYRDVRNHTDYRYPTGIDQNTAVNLNSNTYGETGIYKFINCVAINGPWADLNQRQYFYMNAIRYDNNSIYQLIFRGAEVYARTVSEKTNSYPGWSTFAMMNSVTDLSDRLQGFTMQQTMFQHRVDYDSPSGTISNQTVDFNAYKETGILKVVNCLVQNGPYKSDNRHSVFLKTTNLDGQTQYQTVYEGDNLYGRKLYNGSGQWHKYTNTPI